MRFLCISDIHGHARALERVLDEGNGRGFHQLLVAGDHLFPGPAPLETWKLLTQNNAICVQGLTDAAVSSVDPNALEATTDAQQARLEQLMRFHEELGDLIVARLARLKPQARLPLETGHELVLVHGSPADPTEPMTPDMDDDEINALLADDPADIIVCGASHVPFQRQIGDVRVVSVGSVGEAPAEGFAHATIIDATPFGTVSVEQFDVEL